MVCQIQGEIQTINLFDISHIIREIWNKKCRELAKEGHEYDAGPPFSCVTPNQYIK